MGRNCPQCNSRLESEDEIVYGVFHDTNGPPGADTIKHAFCDYDCYEKWSKKEPKFPGEAKGKRILKEVDWSI